MTLTLKGRGGYVVALKGQGACTCHEEEEGNEQEHLESSFPGHVYVSIYGQNTSSDDSLLFRQQIWLTSPNVLE